MSKDHVTVSTETFEEIEKKNQDRFKNIDEINKAFRTKEYLDKELTWNRSDNSYYDAEGCKFDYER